MTFRSPAIAKEMQRIYGNDVKVVRVEMRHKEEISKYIKKIEEAHEKAANSKLTFP